MSEELTNKSGAVAEKKNAIISNALTKASTAFLSQINDAVGSMGLKLSNDQSEDVLTGVQAMNRVLSAKGLKFSDTDSSSITDVLEKIAILGINLAAYPAEGYLELRKQYVTRSDGSKDFNNFIWVWNFGVQGAGNEKILSKYGRSVKQVYQPWLVREGDVFKYPHFKGIEQEPPEWEPKGTGKYIRVVYPVEMIDGKIQYLISERADVKNNLVAHINNNLMAKKYDSIRDKVLAECADKTVDQILDDPKICQEGNVSPAWTSIQSRESMILTKMKNNATKPFPKEFTNSFIESEYASSGDEGEADNTVTFIDATKNVNTEADKQAVKAIDQGTASVKQPIPEAFAKAAEKKTAEAVKVSQAPKNDAIVPDTDDRPEYEDLPANNYANDDKQSSGASGSGDSSDDLPF